MKKCFSKFSIIYLFFFLSVGFVFISSSVGQATEVPKRGGWLKVATDSTAVGLDPHLTLAFSSYTFLENVYETLVRYDKTMDLEPSLATSWELPDDLTYIFHLRKGVKWHDGTDFTAEDVKFSFERLIDPNTKAPRGKSFKSISKIEIPDKHTVRIHMSKPMPQFLVTIASAWFAPIVSKAAVEKYGSLHTNVVGTGPIKPKKY